ncbi:MAG: hypothetical protein AB1704_20145 [Pseudomonadota bacterium]
MRAFRVLVGKFEIVGTTGAANGRLPALKSEAVAFDVIDRTSSGNGDKQYVSRDQPLDVAFDYCVRKALVRSMH